MNKPYTYKPVRFFLITNVIMWTTWSIAAYFSYQKSGASDGLISLFETIGLFSPVGTALWMIFTSKSPELKRDFFNRLLNLKLIKLSSIPAIVLIMPAAMAISIVLSSAFFGQSLDQLNIATAAPFASALIPVPVLLFGAAFIEELGWKGYGVDSLRGNRTFFTATLMYAVLWAFWHIPTFFVNGYYQNMLIRTNPLFALNFFVSIIPAAFIINWLWYKNKGSILTAVLCHAAINYQGILQMGQIAKCIETVVLIVIAAVIVAFDKKMFFGKFPAEIGIWEPSR